MAGTLRHLDRSRDCVALLFSEVIEINDECRMSNDERSPKLKGRRPQTTAPDHFRFRHWDFFPQLEFVIRHFFKFARSSCGTSSILPSLANCSARKYATIEDVPQELRANLKK